MPANSRAHKTEKRGAKKPGKSPMKKGTPPKEAGAKLPERQRKHRQG